MAKPKKFEKVKIYYYSGNMVDTWLFYNTTKMKACTIVKKMIENLRIVSVIGKNPILKTQTV